MIHLSPSPIHDDPERSTYPDRREYPVRPIVGVAGVVIEGDFVLLIQRGREPMRGAWSLPGGALELGETTAEGVAREVWEETGVHVRPVSLVATLDRIVRDEAGAVQFHYLLVDWCCVPVVSESREPVCGDDALDARWVPLADLQDYGLPEITMTVIERARAALAEVR